MGDLRFVDATEFKRDLSVVLDGVGRRLNYMVRRNGVLLAALVPWDESPRHYIPHARSFLNQLTGSSGDGDLKFIDASDLKWHMSAVLDGVAQGEAYIVRRYRKPLAALVPWQETQRQYLAAPAAFLGELARDARYRALDRQRAHTERISRGTG